MKEDGQALCDDITSHSNHLNFSKKYEVINENLYYLWIKGEEGQATLSIVVIQLDMKT
jgi:hypothetical protein